MNITSHLFGGDTSRKFLGLARPRKVSAANFVTAMSVQGHRCLLSELKLCNMTTCIGDKTGGWEITGGRPPPGPSLEPRLPLYLGNPKKVIIQQYSTPF